MPGTNPMNIKLMTTIRVRIVKEVMTTMSMTTTIMMMTYDEDGVNGDYKCMVYFFSTIKIH